MMIDDPRVYAFHHIVRYCGGRGVRRRTAVAPSTANSRRSAPSDRQHSAADRLTPRAQLPLVFVRRFCRTVSRTPAGRRPDTDALRAKSPRPAVVSPTCC